jgi:hypothetical protein
MIVQFKFKMDGNMKFGISAGYVQPKKSNVPAFVKARTDEVMGHNSITTFEAGDISDECEMVTITTMTGGKVIKPNRDCVAILTLYMTPTNYTNELTSIINEGWSLIDVINVGVFNRKIVVLSRKSKGGQIYAGAYGPTGWTTSVLALLYGAKSVELVESGNPDINTVFSYPYDVGVNRSLYGFSTAAPTTKTRLYICARALSNEDNANRCSDKSLLPSSYTLPDEYSFTYSNGENGIEPNIRVSFDKTNNNGGLAWFIQYKDNPSSSFTPIGSSNYASVVLDINYD